MSSPFGAEYATAYDALYHEKDYKAECDLLLTVLAEHGGPAVRRVLDLGCGTGSHALVLAERGVEVVGVDRSGAMLEQARTKVAGLREGQRPSFVLGDVRTVRLDRTFDAVIMMFAVLGYQHTNADVIDALSTARAHLDPGGSFAFDCWYGPTVIVERPSDRIHVAELGTRRVIRVASATLETRRHLCSVDYRLWSLEGARLLDEVRERHVMRYFFPMELELLLQQAGFSLERLGGFPDFSVEPGPSTWNVLAVAVAV